MHTHLAFNKIEPFMSLVSNQLGKDAHGQQYYDNFKEEGVNVDFIKFEENVPSGVASIMVGANDGNF